MALIVGTNSYISVSDANTYFIDRLNSSAWLLAGAIIQPQALVTASRQISLLVKTACKLPFTPPLSVLELETATAELALAFIADPALITAGSTAKNIKKAKAGSADVTFFRPTSGSRFPPNVMTILAEGGCIDGASISAPFASGTGAASEFCDTNRFGVSQGFK